MKVVLFCGGLGMRMRGADDTPKPLAPLGARPLIWHVMRYYAHFGHRDFILCLGHGAAAIKRYFLDYDECLSNDFVMDGGGRIRLLSRDIQDWQITFVETGLRANLGERLAAVERHLRGEEMFLATYADGLTDFPLPRLVDEARANEGVGTFLAVRPNDSFHVVSLGERNRVTAVRDAGAADLWINGGFFVFRNAIFNYLGPGEELVIEPFQRLMTERRLFAVPYQGFWRSIDTQKDLQMTQAELAGGDAPWQVWHQAPPMSQAAIPGSPPPVQLVQARW